MGVCVWVRVCVARAHKPPVPEPTYDSSGWLGGGAGLPTFTPKIQLLVQKLPLSYE